MKDDFSETSSTPAKRRLWVVSELYYPEMTSTGYYLTKIAEGLADEFDVKVICGQPNYSARGTTAPKRELLNGVEIFRVFGTRLDKNVIPFRLINMVTLSFSVFVRSLLNFRNADQVLVVTTPPLLPFLTDAACRMRGARHILLIHDCYPEILYAAGKLVEESFFAKFLERITRKLYKRADRLVVVGRDMRTRVLQKSEGEKPCAVIPNWAELETVSPAPRESNSMLKELGLQRKLVFLYAGNMGYPNDIESFIEAAEKLKELEPTIHFIFLGAGVKKSLLESAVKDKQLENITVLDSRPRSEQQTFLNACDVGIVSLVGKMQGVSMPSRTYNILAAGKPILALCDADSEIARVVIEEDSGWWIEPGDADSLVDILVRIRSEADQLAELGMNARKAAVNKYSVGMAVEKYKVALSN